MITLFTGLPGNGKTLFALWYIKAKFDKAIAEGKPREVFYYNIKDLALPWTVFDPQKWFELPVGSIIVIDECQEVFPKKPNGSKLPDYYEELAKHRHRGYDIFLITQHPSLLDNFVRKLCGQHFHSIRKFGMERATIWEWQAVNDNPEKPSSHKNAVSHKFAFPKEAYSWYKSAEVHTVKRRIPAKLVLGVLFVLAVVAAGVYAVHSVKNRGKVPAGDPVAAGAVAASPIGAGLSAARASAVFDPVSDARVFIEKSSPRVAGLQHTAPKYDELTKPTRVPVPAACIQRGTLQSKSGASCKCYSQQGTAMNVPFDMCMSFARDGFFQEFNPNGGDSSGRPDDAGRGRVASPDVQVASDSRSVLMPDSPHVYTITGTTLSK